MPDDTRSSPTPEWIAQKKAPVVANGVLAMIVVVLVEVMFFAGLVSAFTIVKSSVAPTAWPPSFQPRLPVEATAFNSINLLASGVLAVLAYRAFKAKDQKKKAQMLLTVATLLGAVFVVVQGYEWTKLIAQGLTLQSSTYGSFFYVIIGCHALHAVIAIACLSWAAFALKRNTLKASEFATVLFFWLFVVLVWPALYLTVYL